MLELDLRTDRYTFRAPGPRDPAPVRECPRDLHCHYGTLLKGTYYQCFDAQCIATLLEPGDRLHLRREPDNLFDQNAITAIYRGERVGYIDRALAPYLRHSKAYCVAWKLEPRPTGDTIVRLAVYWYRLPRIE